MLTIRLFRYQSSGSYDITYKTKNYSFKIDVFSASGEKIVAKELKFKYKTTNYYIDVNTMYNGNSKWMYSIYNFGNKSTIDYDMITKETLPSNNYDLKVITMLSIGLLALSWVINH